MAVAAWGSLAIGQVPKSGYRVKYIGHPEGAYFAPRYMNDDGLVIGFTRPLTDLLSTENERLVLWDGMQFVDLGRPAALKANSELYGIPYVTNSGHVVFSLKESTSERRWIFRIDSGTRTVEEMRYPVACDTCEVDAYLGGVGPDGAAWGWVGDGSQEQPTNDLCWFQITCPPLLCIIPYPHEGFESLLGLGRSGEDAHAFEWPPSTTVARGLSSPGPVPCGGEYESGKEPPPRCWSHAIESVEAVSPSGLPLVRGSIEPRGGSACSDPRQPEGYYLGAPPSTLQPLSLPGLLIANAVRDDGAVAGWTETFQLGLWTSQGVQVISEELDVLGNFNTRGWGLTLGVPTLLVSPGGDTVRLSEYLPPALGWSIRGGASINNKGQVLAVARNALTGEDGAVILDPDPKEGPVITAARRSLEGVFLEKTDGFLRFDVDVDWRGAQPGRLEYSVNGDATSESSEVTAEGGTVRVPFTRFPPRFSPSAIEIVAFNSDNLEGPAWREEVWVFPYPGWLREALAASGAVGHKVGASEVTYTISATFPLKGREGSVDVPEAVWFLGGKQTLGLGVDFEGLVSD